MEENKNVEEILSFPDSSYNFNGKACIGFSITRCIRDGVNVYSVMSCHDEVIDEAITWPGVEAIIDDLFVGKY